MLDIVGIVVIVIVIVGIVVIVVVIVGIVVIVIVIVGIVASVIVIVIVNDQQSNNVQQTLSHLLVLLLL